MPPCTTRRWTKSHGPAHKRAALCSTSRRRKRQLTKHVAHLPSSSRLLYLPSMISSMTRKQKAREYLPLSKPIANEPRQCGCGLLQYLQGQVSSGLYPTTGGDYLETIFTHRDMFRAYPQGHQECVLGFHDLARAIERREWRTDRDSDAEAVAAFRNEAWIIANATTFLVTP